MDGVGTGHYIFAVIFFVVFFIGIFFAYSKDKKMHKRYYSGASTFILAIVVIFFLLYLARNLLF